MVPKNTLRKSEIVDTWKQKGFVELGNMIFWERKKEKVDQLQLETLSENYENKHAAQEER